MLNTKRYKKIISDLGLFASDEVASLSGFKKLVEEYNTPRKDDYKIILSDGDIRMTILCEHLGFSYYETDVLEKSFNEYLIRAYGNDYFVGNDWEREQYYDYVLTQNVEMEINCSEIPIEYQKYIMIENIVDDRKDHLSIVDTICIDNDEGEIDGHYIYRVR